VCSEDDPKATPEVLKKLGFTGDLNAIHANHGMGCKQCEGKGFKGRRGIYEVLRITKPLEEAILRNEQAPALLKAAKLDGFRTMQEIGRDLIAQGILSIEEFQTTLNLENH
jgi:type IV pilus assembly protein PilB